MIRGVGRCELFVPASFRLLLCCTQTEGVKQKLGGHSDNPGQRQWWLRGEPQLWGGKWYQQEGWVARAQEKQESEGPVKGWTRALGTMSRWRGSRILLGLKKGLGWRPEPRRRSPLATQVDNRTIQVAKEAGVEDRGHWSGILISHWCVQGI